LVGLGEDFFGSLFERVVLFSLVLVPIAEEEEEDGENAASDWSSSFSSARLLFLLLRELDEEAILDFEEEVDDCRGA
jgi:hypothetical protein